MQPQAPVPLPASPEPAHPAPVLDIEAGVERLMGNRAIYLRALARFRHDYRKTVAAIDDALGGGNLSQAWRLTHTLKGAAGMIEAPALLAATLALESALRDGAEDVDGLLARVDAALGEVLRTLDGMTLPDMEPVPSDLATDGDDVARLRAMLDIGDGAAVEQLAIARDALAACMGQGELEELSAAVAAFDYERALALLDRQDGTAGK